MGVQMSLAEAVGLLANGGGRRDQGQRVANLGGGGAQGLDGDDLHLKAGRKGALNTIGRVGRAAGLGQAHRLVDHGGVDEGRVALDPDNVADRAGGLGAAGDAIQNVAARAAMDGIAARHHQPGQAVVGGVAAGGDDDLVQAPGAAQPLQLSQNHRLALERGHGLAGQTLGAHSGLDDSEDHGVLLPLFITQRFFEAEV